MHTSRRLPRIIAAPGLLERYHDRSRKLTVAVLCARLGFGASVQLHYFVRDALPASSLNISRFRLLAEILGFEGDPFVRLTEEQYQERLKFIALGASLGPSYPLLPAERAK